MLLMEVNHAGFLGTFDFLYLPIDTDTGANRGYAFLNFLDPSLSWTFRTMYEGRKMTRFNSSKIITIVPATLQGFEANYMHYAFARVSRGDPAARPLFLRVWASEVAGTYASSVKSPNDLTCKEPKSLPVPARGRYSTRLPSQLQIQQVAKKLAEAAPAP
ncbi:ML5 [Symbiodinium pilosum]|uniref:ML5 protein n=1 Tax=Symbiodinium pilosum TaxID=2952 RepID=A0A812Y367_SYMPI|nr:ML5 [Symbiodinium pilosum]